jgi:peptidoglycan/xylan/chitin deacetylase (PgdA/CDA1 family)
MRLRRLHMIPLLLLVVVILASSDYPVIMWWGFGVVIFLQIGIVVYGCINIQSGYFVQALCKGKTDEKVVALTFDDGPNATYSGSILDTLRKYHVPAAFFVIGRNIVGMRRATLLATTASRTISGLICTALKKW